MYITRLYDLLTRRIDHAMTVPATLQSFPYTAGVQAIKECSQYATFEEFNRYLLDNMPQNSPKTRKRFATLILRWFFPERSLTGFLPTIWAAYQDDLLLNDLMRVTTLEIEPVIGTFVVDVVLPFAPGDSFPADLAQNYITATYHQYKSDSYDRLMIAAREIRFTLATGR